MHSGVGETVLAAYNLRSRVVREDNGVIRVFWGMLSVKMSQAEFVSFAGMLVDALECPARCGELARCACGRVSRCVMGQISLSHNDLTLWFSPDEFEEFQRLISSARQKLADAPPAPPLGIRWAPRGELFGRN